MPTVPAPTTNTDRVRRTLARSAAWMAQASGSSSTARRREPSGTAWSCERCATQHPAPSAAGVRAVAGLQAGRQVAGRDAVAAAGEAGGAVRARVEPARRAVQHGSQHDARRPRAGRRRRRGARPRPRARGRTASRPAARSRSDDLPAERREVGAADAGEQRPHARPAAGRAARGPCGSTRRSGASGPAAARAPARRRRARRGSAGPSGTARARAPSDVTAVASRVIGPPASGSGRAACPPTSPTCSIGQRRRFAPVERRVGRDDDGVADRPQQREVRVRVGVRVRVLQVDALLLGVAAEPRGARLAHERRLGHEAGVAAVAHLELARRSRRRTAAPAAGRTARPPR